MPEIISYQPKYAEDFKNLNIAWLEKYFVVASNFESTFKCLPNLKFNLLIGKYGNS